MKNMKIAQSFGLCGTKGKSSARADVFSGGVDGILPGPGASGQGSDRSSGGAGIQYPG